MGLYFRTQNKFIVVTGQTYPHRGALKSLGGTFVPDRKAWRIPLSEGSVAALEKLCNSVGGASFDEVEETSSPALIPKPKILEENKPGVTISELYQKVDRVLLGAFPHAFWVIGEVESVSHRAQGTYITLAEKDAYGATLSLNALIWQNTLKDLSKKHSGPVVKDLLTEGLKLCLLCRLNLYKGRGTLSLTVMDLNPSYTKGLLALEREKTVAKLKKAELYDANRRQPLTRFPFRIGLVTAKDSRAYSDFCHQLREKELPCEVLFVPASMQGAGTLASLKKAFKLLRSRNCDMIVITRGGGSASDLRVFDDFEVAQLIASSEVPVIAAIGHHDDTSVSEEVAFKALKTPTAAAEFVVRHFEQGALYLEELALKITKSLERVSELCTRKHESLCVKFSESLTKTCVKHELSLNRKEKELTLKAQSFVAQKELNCSHLRSSLEASFERNISSYKERLSFLSSQLAASSFQGLSNLKLRVESLSSRLLSYDPRPWLKKGWTRLYRRDSSLVRSLDSLVKNETIEAHFLEGTASLEVKEIVKKRKSSL